MCEDTKGVITSRQSKKDRQDNGQKDKQWYTKQYMYTENTNSSNTIHTNNQGWTHVLRKDKQFLFHWWYP